MSNEWKWNADAVDAIRIAAASGEFEINGIDGNEILLEGEEHSRRNFGSEPTVNGRWLNLTPFGGGSDWTLNLPKSKAWVIEISLASGELEIQDVHARINAQLGSGEVELENCRGVFNIRSGSGDVRMENCVQADAPQAPEHTAERQNAQPQGVPPAPGAPPIPPVPPMPGIPPIPPIPPVNIKMRMGKGFHVEGPDDWEDYGREWEEWGERFGEQVSHWAENFSQSFSFGFKFGADEGEKRDGFHIRLGSGDLQMEEIDALVLTTRIGNGDVHIEQGRVGELDVENSRGDIQIDGVLPTAAWGLATRHGDLQLNLPGDAHARIDAATRHGEIDCDAPLVRVGRPGPGARHGGRMVGTIGEGIGEPVDIHLESQHGDININMERRPSRYAGQPAAAQKAAPAKQAVPAQPAVPAERATEPQRGVATREPAAPPSAVVPVTVTDLPQPEAALGAGKESRVQVYDSQFAILQALQSGEITVAEAEMLLRSLRS